MFEFKRHREQSGVVSDQNIQTKTRTDNREELGTCVLW